MKVYVWDETEFFSMVEPYYIQGTPTKTHLAIVKMDSKSSYWRPYWIVHPYTGGVLWKFDSSIAAVDYSKLFSQGADWSGLPDEQCMKRYFEVVGFRPLPFFHPAVTSPVVLLARALKIQQLQEQECPKIQTTSSMPSSE
jgi:hypothetical protein